MHSVLSTAAQGFDDATCTLLIKFGFRTKPKQFTLESPASCRSVCQLLSQLLQDLDSAYGRTTPALDRLQNGGGGGGEGVGIGDGGADSGVRAQPRSRRNSRDSSDGGRDGGDGSTSGPPEWLLSALESVHSREWAIAVYAQVRAGWCCREHLAEAVFFGVLMPLAVAGYWLKDASFRKSRSSGSNHWLPAACELHNPMLVSRQVYHHGKYADAKDLAYQDGSVWRLEPAFNTSVKLLLEYGSRYRFSTDSWPSVWNAITLTSVVDEERPHCDGQVMDSVEETRARCDETTWLPHELVHLNGTQPCFVDRNDRHHVYLNIEDPHLFYFDMLLIGLCFATSATIALCVFAQHWVEIRAWASRIAARRAERRRSRDDDGAGVGAGAPDADEERSHRPDGRRHRRTRSRSGEGSDEENDFMGLSVLAPESVKHALGQAKRSFTEMI